MFDALKTTMKDNIDISVLNRVLKHNSIHAWLAKVPVHLESVVDMSPMDISCDEYEDWYAIGGDGSDQACMQIPAPSFVVGTVLRPREKNPPLPAPPNACKVSHP